MHVLDLVHVLDLALAEVTLELLRFLLSIALTLGRGYRT